SLQSQAYPVLEHGLYTIGVQTLLLTGLGETGADDEKVKIVAQLLRNRQDAIENKMKEYPNWPSALTLVGATLRKEQPGVMHKSAQPYIVTGRLRPATWWQLLSLASAILMVAIVGLTLERGRRIAARYTSKIIFLLVCGLLWAIAAIWLQALEGDINED